MQNLKADISNKSFKKIYLFYGDEQYLSRAYKKMIKNAIVGDDDDMNYAYYENAGDNLRKIEETADTLPFFAERRLIILENCGLFKKDNSFADYVPNIPDTTTIVVMEREVDKRSRLFKAVSANGYACEFKKQSIDELKVFATRYFAKAGKNISQSAMQLFIDSVGDDMNNIVNEAEKVIAYSGERSVIEGADISAVCVSQTESKIFEIVDAILAGDSKKVFSIYEDLITLRESPFGILGLIRNNYVRMLAIRELSQKGLDASEIAQRVKSQDWLVKKTVNKIKKIPAKKLENAVSLMADTEFAIKTGDMGEQTGVEILLANLLTL